MFYIGQATHEINYSSWNQEQFGLLLIFQSVTQRSTLAGVSFSILDNFYKKKNENKINFIIYSKRQRWSHITHSSSQPHETQPNQQKIAARPQRVQPNWFVDRERNGTTSVSTWSRRLRWSGCSVSKFERRSLFLIVFGCFFSCVCVWLYRNINLFSATFFEAPRMTMMMMMMRCADAARLTKNWCKDRSEAAQGLGEEAIIA